MGGSDVRGRSEALRASVKTHVNPSRVIDERLEWIFVECFERLYDYMDMKWDILVTIEQESA